MGCLQASQMCPFDISDKKLKNEDRKVCNQLQPTQFIVVLAQRGITNWFSPQFQTTHLDEAATARSYILLYNASIYIY